MARWDDGPRGARALARWRAGAREAAKQARRAVEPAVSGPHSTAEVAHRARDAALALVCDGTAEVSLAGVALPDAGEIVLVVGPEGGLTDGERAAFAGAGAVGVRMGPAVLRTSSAAAVALGALGARTRRWG